MLHVDLSVCMVGDEFCIVGDEACIVGDETGCSSSKSEGWHNEHTIKWIRYFTTHTKA